MFEVDSAKVRALAVNHGASLKRLKVEIGLNAATLKKLMTDGATVNLKTLGKLAKFFGVDGSELLKGR